MHKILFIHVSHPPIIGEICRDFCSALKAIDGFVVESIELDPIYQAQNDENHELRQQLQQEALGRIRAFQPELAIGYGWRGILPVGEDNHLLNVLGIPYFCLCFDNLLHFSDLIRRCAHRDNVVILGLDPDLFPLYRQAGFRNCIYFPIGTSLHLHAGGTANMSHSAGDRESQVFFVGGITRTEPLHAWFSTFSEEEHDFVRLAAVSILRHGEHRLSAIAGRYEGTAAGLDYPLPPLHDPSLQWLWFRIDRDITSRLRVLTVLAASESAQVTVCGSYQGWLEGLAGANVRFMPNVDYRAVLPGLYQNAKIVLVRSPLCLENAIQQRCLDAGAVNAFVLTEYRPILEKHFVIGEEIAVYYSLDDLKEKVTYYLNHDEERIRIAGNLRRRVLSEHTWMHRARFFQRIISGDKQLP